MIPHDNILPSAIEKTRSRDSDYGLQKGVPEQWETAPLDSLANAAKYKTDRAIQPGTSFAKAKDDLEDAYNNIAALYERVIRLERKANIEANLDFLTGGFSQEDNIPPDDNPDNGPPDDNNGEGST